MVDRTDNARCGASIHSDIMPGQRQSEGEPLCSVTSIPDTRGSPLTKREREVLVWVANGKSYWETGQILGISEGTVRIHLASIRKKLNAANTTNAVAKALHQKTIVLVSQEHRRN